MNASGSNRKNLAVRRVAWRVIFGEGAERWSMSDPSHPSVEAAYDTARDAIALGKVDSKISILSSIASDLNYLINICPTTKLACAKLADIRAAVRKLELEEADDAATK